MAKLTRIALVALVLDLLSWPPLLAGAFLAHLAAGAGSASSAVPALYWPVLLLGQYACWVLFVLVADWLTAPRRPPHGRRRPR